jgi:FkbM family methyltransferase
MEMHPDDNKICKALEEGKAWEEDVAEAIERYASPDWTFLDLGAHIGSFTMLAAPIYKDVIAVEANPSAFRFLKRNVELNELDNVELHNVAVWEHDEGVQFVPVLKNTGMSWVAGRGEKYESVGLPSKTLGQILGDRRPEVWKVDIEGAEYKALKEIDDFLPYVIITEFCASQLARTSDATGEMYWDLLHRYDWFRTDTWTQIGYVELPQWGYGNVLLIRRE